MIGKRIQKLRKLHGYSQGDIAKQLYVSHQAVGKWERDEATPNPEAIVKMANIFGVSTDVLLGRDGEITVPNERIKQSRLALGLTLAQVAGALGVTKETIQSYENGEIENIKQEMILRLSELFSVSPAYLMGWTDELYVYDEKKTAPTDGGGLSPLDAQLMDLLRFVSDDQKKMLLAQIDTLLKSQ